MTAMTTISQDSLVLPLSLISLVKKKKTVWKNPKIWKRSKHNWMKMIFKSSYKISKKPRLATRSQA